MVCPILVCHIPLVCLVRVATFESIQNSLTFPWENKFSLTISFIFQSVKKQLLTAINGNCSTHLGFLKGKILTVIISRPWVKTCKADIYINTTKVGPLSYDWSFSLKTMSWQNSLTIPWHDITKFPDMGQMAKIPWHFIKIRWLFHDLENFCFSLTRGNPASVRNICYQLVPPTSWGVLYH